MLNMPTILKEISLDMVLFNAQFALTGVTPRYKYADEKRTDELEGYVYKVTDLTSLKAISVFVPHTKPIISSDEVDRTNASGERIFVDFDDAVITPYVAKRSGTIEDSIKATNVRLVKNN